MVIIFALVKTNVTNLKFPVLNSVDFFGPKLSQPMEWMPIFFQWPKSIGRPSKPNSASLIKHRIKWIEYPILIIRKLCPKLIIGKLKWVPYMKQKKFNSLLVRDGIGLPVQWYFRDFSYVFFWDLHLFYLTFLPIIVV